MSLNNFLNDNEADRLFLLQQQSKPTPRLRPLRRMQRKPDGLKLVPRPPPDGVFIA